MASIDDTCLQAAVMVSASNIDGAQLATDAMFTTCCDSYMQGFTSVTASVIWCKAGLRIP